MKPNSLVIHIPKNINAAFGNISSSQNEAVATSSSSVSKVAAEVERFLQDCNGGYLEQSGIVANFKRNQFLKKSGMAVNDSVSAIDLKAELGGNNNSPKKASTREAFAMVIDREELLKSGTSEDIAILNALTGHRDEVCHFRTKSIKYGNHNALQEVLSQKLYALTGLTSPDTRLLISGHQLPITDANGIRQLIPEASVTSPIVTGYYDLGNFFVDDAIKRFIPAESHDFWEITKNKINEITKQDTITDKDKIARVKLMEEIYELLPDYFHNEIEKSFAASKFIANWDFANFDLNNIGCKFTLNDQGQIIGLKSVFVDFGNSGVIGFGGQYKECSLDRANTEAKKKTEKPDDYDPQLTLTEVEKQLIATTTATLEQERENGQNSGKESVLGRLFKNLAEASVSQEEAALIRSIRFKTSHHIRADESVMEINEDTSGFLTFSDLPRNTPFAFLLKPALRKKTNVVTELVTEKVFQAVDSAFSEGVSTGVTPPQKTQEILQASKKLNLQNSIYLDSEIEMAFRLSLIPDVAIDHVVKKWNLSEEYPNIFPLPTNLQDPEKYRTAGLAKIFRDRKNTLAQSIPEEVINKWIVNNKAEALAAEQSVRIALLEETDSIFEIQEETSFSARTAYSTPTETNDQTTQLASEIKRQIKQAQNKSITIRPETMQEFNNESNILEQNIIAKTALEDYLKSNSNIPEALTVILQKDLETKADTISNLTSKTIKLETEIDQQGRQSTVNFIKNHAEEWKQQMAAFKLNCCDLFDLSKIKRIFKLRNRGSHDHFGRDDEIRIESDRLEENEIIDSRNRFTHREFVKILDTLSPALQSELSFSPSRVSGNQFAPKHLTNSNSV